MEHKIQCPNFSYIVGEDVAQKLIKSAGSLGALARCSSARLQKLSSDESGAVSNPILVSLGGILAEAPIFSEVVKNSEDGNVDPKLLRKALDILSRKAIMAIKIDLARTETDGSVGKRLLDEVRTQIGLQLNKGKVEISKTTALEPPDKRKLLERLNNKTKEQEIRDREANFNKTLSLKVLAKFFDEKKEEDSGKVGSSSDFAPELISYIQQELKLQPSFKKNRRQSVNFTLQSENKTEENVYALLSSMTPKLALL